MKYHQHAFPPLEPAYSRHFLLRSAAHLPTAGDLLRVSVHKSRVKRQGINGSSKAVDKGNSGSGPLNSLSSCAIATPSTVWISSTLMMMACTRLLSWFLCVSKGVLLCYVLKFLWCPALTNYWPEACSCFVYLFIKVISINPQSIDL